VKTIFEDMLIVFSLYRVILFQMATTPHNISLQKLLERVQVISISLYSDAPLATLPCYSKHKPCLSLTMQCLSSIINED